MSKLIYDEREMVEMIQTLQRSSKELREVAGQMQQTARVIAQGGLMGEGGENFQQSLNSTLNNAIERLSQKLEEQSRFVHRELEQLKAAAKTSRD